MANTFPPADLPMQDPPTDPTGEQFREAFHGFAAAARGSHEIMPGTPNSGMISGGTVPSDHSEPQRAPAWPEIPPAWPEVPPPSSFTPTARSFGEAAPQQDLDATATMAGMTGVTGMAGPAADTGWPQTAPSFGGPEHPQATPSFGGPEHPQGAPGFGGPGHPQSAPSFGGPGHPQSAPPGHPQATPSFGGPDRPQGAPSFGGHEQAFGAPGGAERPHVPGGPFTPSVRSYAEAAPPVSTAPPPPPQPEDPYRPFVTAGQISGPKTPPAHRQQELWNTVFGENYRAIDEYEDDEPGRPVWLYALVASVVAALVGVLVWAFAAGPLSSGGSAEAATAKPSPATSRATAKPQAQIPRLPVYKGTASPVNGVLTDAAARITLPKLGGPWQADADAAQVKATYGFTSRQYVPAGLTTKGKREFAQVMSGPLVQSLAVKYTTPDKLGPVVSAVMFRARQTQFPKDNKVTKVAQQRLARNGLTGLLAAYKVTADGATTTVVVAAVNTGADLPSIVYMAVPELKEDLLPDINTVFRSIKPIR